MGHPSICVRRFGRGEHVHRLGGERFGFGVGVGVGGKFFRDCAGIFKDHNRQAARWLLVVGCWLLVEKRSRFGEERGELGFGGAEVELQGGVVGCGGEGLEQGGEFELAEELAAGCVVEGLGAHRVEGELDGHCGVDRHQLLREQNIVAIIL